jgi:uncharacterized membrane protein
MNTKKTNIILLSFLSLVVLLWYIYYRYSNNVNSILAILVTSLFIITLVINHITKSRILTQFHEGTVIDKARIILSALNFILFTGFFIISLSYGGSAASDGYARNRYEYYEVGQYYLSSHGNFTLVTFQIWNTMRIIELITIPTFIFTFFWNFIHIVKTKGWAFLLSGSNSQRI